MGRAFLRETFTDQYGNAQTGKTVTLTETDGTTPLARPYYTTPAGMVPATTITTDSLGEILLYSPIPGPLKIAIQGRSTPAVSSFLEDEGNNPISLLGWGADPDAADNTVVIQDALDEAVATGRSVYCNGLFAHTGLTLAGPITLFGDGMSYSGLILAASASTSQDNLTVTGNATGMRGLTIRDLELVPASAAGGRHALVFDTRVENTFIANANVERCSLIGSTAGRAVASLVDASPSVPMLFDSRFVACLIGNGIKLLNAADSMWMQHCLLYGANVGMEISTVAGAGAWTIRDSTMVNAGGGVWVKSNAIALAIRDCYLEQPSAYTGGSGNGYLIDLDATTIGDLMGVSVTGCTLSPGVGNSMNGAIRAKNPYGLFVDDNKLGLVESGQYGLRVVTGGSGVTFGRANQNTGGLGTAVLQDAAITDIYDATLDKKGVALLAAGATLSLGATLCGHISVFESSNNNLAAGLLHGAAHAVTSISATNFSGAGTGILLTTSDAASTTGIVLRWDGTNYSFINRAITSRTIRWDFRGAVA